MQSSSQRHDSDFSAFDATSLPARQRGPATYVPAPIVMTDPQHERFGIDERVPRGVVSEMVYPQIHRPVVIDPQSLISGGVAAPLAIDPAEEAARIIADARGTARSMLAQARDVIATERAQAVERGHAEGFAAGAAEADEEMAGLVRTCEQIGVNVMEERARVLAENEGDIVELAMSVANRIVAAAIDIQPELVIEVCRGAMRKAFQRGTMHVLANPADLELLRAAGPRLAEELGGVEHLDFIEERRLDRGSVIVRTPMGEIDATIKGKSEKIELALREGIEARRAEADAG